MDVAAQAQEEKCVLCELSFHTTAMDSLAKTRGFKSFPLYVLSSCVLVCVETAHHRVLGLVPIFLLFLFAAHLSPPPAFLFVQTPTYGLAFHER